MTINTPQNPPNSNPRKSSDEEKTPTSPPLSSSREPIHPSSPNYRNQQSPKDSSKIYTNEPLDTARLSENKGKNSENFSKEKKEEPENFYTYARSNKEKIIAYILIALGLFLMLLLNSLLGELIIGMVAGYYFASQVIYYLRNLHQIVSGQDQLRYVILTAVLLGLFIAAPGIFIGAIIVAVFKQVMQGPQNL